MYLLSSFHVLFIQDIVSRHSLFFVFIIIFITDYI
uniref:Uncharacterized protein n=1 Tax=Kuetzingia canaliculata TaxID=228262 RepID=A0A1Z1MQ00_KUECA|nr:hypothetical protein [Kuetzingia canaliculata]ARW67824.1 hypothetical protein [Kuetzingia canaliculata]